MTGMRSGKVAQVETLTMKVAGLRTSQFKAPLSPAKKLTTDPLQMIGVRGKYEKIIKKKNVVKVAALKKKETR